MYRILFFLLICCQVAVAQENPHRIEGKADAKPGLIRLRWAPSSTIAWEMGNKYGYQVERFTLAVNGELVEHPKATLLTPQPLKPYTLAEMETATEKEERVAIIAEIVYGEKPEQMSVEKDGFGAFYQNQNMSEWRMNMALLTCDLSVVAAKSAGLYIEDSNVKKGERYVYRISLVQQPKNLVIDTAFVVTSVDEPTLLARPRELAIVCEDSIATLGWLMRFTGEMYTAYSVERSEDGKNFKPVTDLPIIPTSPDANGFSYFKDSLPRNDVKYFYRVRGITPFGDYGPYSETVSGMGVSTIQDRPVMDTIIVEDNKRIQLRWILPGELPKQLSKIVIVRADNSKGPFLPIATFNKATYTYTDLKPFNTNFYRIKGITKQGKEIYSFPYFAQLIDSTPPASPVGLLGRVDSLGVVTLQWTADTEPDMQGYRIFRANSMKEEFVEVTREIVVKPMFNDTVTLRTLTSSVFYKVIAVDKNYNTSGYSKPLQLKRPDTIAPVAPLFRKAYRSDSLMAVMLEWENSSSDDVVKYTLYSINVKDSSRREVATWDSAHLIRKYADTALRQGNTYYYELMVWDGAGNKAKDVSGDVWFESGKRARVNKWAGEADQENKRIRLRWQYSEEDVKVYKIYRAKNEEPFTLYYTVDGTAADWNDTAVFLGNVYKYKITAVMKGDIKSVMSKVVEIVY